MIKQKIEDMNIFTRIGLAYDRLTNKSDDRSYTVCDLPKVVSTLEPVKQYNEVYIWQPQIEIYTPSCRRNIIYISRLYL